MKKYLISLIFCLNLTAVFCQNNTTWIGGRISFISSLNVYIKFLSTEGISINDTLFIKNENSLIPVITVSGVSSISCVGNFIDTIKLNVNDSCWANVEVKQVEYKNIIDSTSLKKLSKNENQPITIDTNVKTKKHELLTGRIMISSASNFSNSIYPYQYRMRYSVSLNASDIIVKGLSADCYIDFVQSNFNAKEIKINLFNGLKIYHLGVNYILKNKLSIYIGRKINNNLSSLGAMDGIHLEILLGHFKVGLLNGFSPDHSTYGFNFNLFQTAAFLSHQKSFAKNSLQSTLAIINQTNSGVTDRRFLYFQHSNTLVKNLSTFISCEADLYEFKDSIKKNLFKPVSLYFISHYRLLKNIWLTASFDMRKNIIYYETYKGFLDQLLEEQSRNGANLGINFNLLKFIRTGFSASYRFMKGDSSPSNNYYLYMTINKFPTKNSTVSFSANFLNGSFLSGQVYSLILNQNLMNGKFNVNARYSLFKRIYNGTEVIKNQHITEIGCYLTIIKKLYLSANCQLTYDLGTLYNYIYLGIIKRL